jgi:DNA-binding beta-propeller fold protein YncE
MQLKELTFIGKELVRPECVLATAAGNLYVSDFRGGVTQIAANGEQAFFGGTQVPGFGLIKPNGIALLADGHFLVAHLGDTQGGIFKVTRNHQVTPWLTEIEGAPLPPSNFIYLDHQGRYWGTVSTRKIPRAAAYRSDIKDGFIFVVDQQGARIVADELGYTNEVYVTPDGKQLYVNATFTRELWRFDINDKNQLINKKLITHFGKGIFPDGLTMDTEGFLWITSIVSNSVIRVNPTSGEYTVILQDVAAEHLDWVEEAYKQHDMGRPHLDQARSEKLKNISSLAFCGKNLKSITLGCLLGQSLAQVSSQHQGVKPAHWHFDDN